ncbi:hypothetical protein [Williamsia limnetica]|nr:hypothetical protein [Williamsia limnetica]
MKYVMEGTVAMEILLVVLVIAVAIFAVWLWDRLVDGASNVLLRVIAWPFEKLVGASKNSDARRTFRTPQRFQLAAEPGQVREALGRLDGVTSAPAAGKIAPYYLESQSGRVRIGVGNYLLTPYELEVDFTAGWPGTCGEVRYVRWDDDPADDLDIHRELLGDIFGALGALDSMLYVTTEPIAIDTETPPPDPQTRTDPSTRRDFRPGAGAPILPGTGSVAVRSSIGRLPAIPSLAAGLFAIALVVGSCAAMGTFSPTTTSELCSSYREARDGFSYSSSDSVEDIMDKENLGDELSELHDRADNYDDDGVKDDADRIADLGDPVTRSEFTSATTSIAVIC